MENRTDSDINYKRIFSIKIINKNDIRGSHKNLLG